MCWNFHSHFSSFPFFLTTVEPSVLLQDQDFVQHVSQGALLQTFAPEWAADAGDEAALNRVAALPESFQPKGYTLFTGAE